jgi:hypothetical protein
LRYVVALAIAVGCALLLLDGPLWLTVPLGFGIVLLVSKLGDLAMERATSRDSRLGAFAWILVAVAVSGLAMMLYGAAKSTLMPKPQPPSYYGNP